MQVTKGMKSREPHGLKSAGKMAEASLSSILRGHVDGQVDQAVGVAPLVVVPRYELHKGVAQRDAGPDIKNGRGLAADKVGGNHLLVSPVQDALHVAGGRLLDGCHDLIVLCGLL